MNHLLQFVFPGQSAAPLIIGGSAKNGFAFVNLFAYYFPTREQTGVKP
jgi:hypothetical protein